MAFNETHVPNVDDVGAIGVKKKKSFHKKKWNITNYEGYVSRIKKTLLKEFVRNVGVVMCYTMNCCQHFPREKTCCWNKSFGVYPLKIEEHMVLIFQKGCIFRETKGDKIYHYSRFIHLW
jgi:hypothetical protein